MTVPTAPTASTTQGASAYTLLNLTTLTTPFPAEAANTIMTATNTLTKDAFTGVITLTSVILSQAYLNGGISFVKFENEEELETILTIEQKLGFKYFTATKQYAANTKGNFTITITGDNATFTPVVVSNVFAIGPVVTKSAPSGTTLTVSNVTAFAIAATAVDAIDGTITAGIKWILDPPLLNIPDGGATQNITLSEPGTYSLNAQSTDLDGNTINSTSTTITVTDASAPTSLAGTPGNFQVALTWTAPTNPFATLTGYRIEICTDGGATCTVQEQNSTTASGTVTGLTNLTPYTFSVYPITGSGATAAVVGAKSISITSTPTAV